MKRRFQIITSLFSVILSAFTLTSLTLAWINTNESVDRIMIKTGEGKFELHTGIFERHASGATTSVDSEPNYFPTINDEKSSNEAIALDFSHSISKVTLESMVLDEHALNAAILPSYVFELHAHTTLDVSYIRISTNEQPYTGSPAADFSLYTFQYLIVDNSIASPIEYAAPVKLSELEAKTPNNFNGTTPIFFSEGAGANNAYELVVEPDEEWFYTDYFMKSIIVLVKPNPLAFYEFIKAQQLAGTTTKKVGLTFQLYVEFSLVPFGS